MIKRNRYFTRQTITLLLLITAFFKILPEARAWSYHTHRKITADAVRLMPESFRKEFSGHKSHFLKGSTDPDTLIKDFANHAYHPDGSHSDGMYRIMALFDKAVELIRTREAPDKIAYILGLASHYIADLNQPLHTAGSERDPGESEYHTRYERDLNSHLKDLQLPSIEYRPVESVESSVKAMTIEANRYYGNIGAAYRGGRGLSDLIEISDKQIAASIQNVVNFWQGMYKAAGYNFSESAAQAMQATDNTQNWENSTAPTPLNDSININNASAESLSEFFKISPQKAKSIVDARPFNTAYDLAKIDGFTVHFVKRHKDRIKLQ